MLGRGAVRVLPSSFSIGCRVWFYRILQPSVFLPHVVVELLLLSGLRGAMLSRWNCPDSEMAGAIKLSGFSWGCYCIGAGILVWHRRRSCVGRDASFALFRRSRTACWFSGSVCEVAVSIVFGSCGCCSLP